MELRTLTAQHFRCFSEQTWSFSPGVNVLHGPNGSGKTSVLEALYALGHGRSFRTHLTRPMIEEGATSLVLHASCERQEQAGPWVVGLRRHHDGSSTWRLNQTPVQQVKDVTLAMPMHVLDTDSHRAFARGAKYRRAWMDWGLCYDDPTYWDTLKRYQRALQQRNASLKTGPDHQAWDDAVATYGEQLDQARSAYVARVVPQVEAQWERLLGQPCHVVWRYQRGWDDGVSLAEALAQQGFEDRRRGFTQRGPHRADCTPWVQGRLATQWLSQGQQKLLTYALKMGQVQDLQERSGSKGWWLIDDMPAELDASRRARVFEVWHQHGWQVFVTSVDDQWLPKGLEAHTIPLG